MSHAFSLQPSSGPSCGGNDRLCPLTLGATYGVARYLAGVDGDLPGSNPLWRAPRPDLYPPTSQAVLRTAAVCTPQDASLVTRMMIMPGLVRCLRPCDDYSLLFTCSVWAGKPVGWSIAYAWCPRFLMQRNRQQWASRRTGGVLNIHCWLAFISLSGYYFRGPRRRMQ